MTKLGYVGLGDMGSRMVKRLLEAGHEVIGWNRTKSKADWLIEMGMEWGDSPRAVTETCDIVFTMVTNTKAVEAVTQGDDGIMAGLSAGKIYIDMSTMSPKYSRELAEQAAQTGAVMLDAPVSGSIVTLESGKLSIMVGGDKDAFDKVVPVLQAIGPTVHHVGENGLAVSMKIATNLGLAVQMLAFSEAVLLAEKSGIPRELAVEVLMSSVIASPMVKYRGPFVLQHPEGKAWFDCQMMQKDMLLALELGRELDVPLPTTSVTNEFLTAGRAMGIGDYDFSIIFDVLAKMSGIETDRLAEVEQNRNRNNS
jgi:3-hydroxyisobutyrate dehydrogenase-like beta-hydroxyacid dehydrogenase